MSVGTIRRVVSPLRLESESRRASLIARLSLAALLAAAVCWATPALPQDAAEEEDESFGRTVTRVFTDAWDRSTDWLDPDEDVSAMCVALASEEELEPEALRRFGQTIRETWTPPAPQGDLESQSIALEVCLGPNGRSLRRPRLLRPVGPLEPEQSEALLSALAAIEKAAPYEDPGDEYYPWRRVMVLFDAKQGPGAAAIGAPAGDEATQAQTTDAGPEAGVQETNE